MNALLHTCAPALATQVFSTAGNLSTPHTDPDFLINLVLISRNKKSFKPSLKDIKDKYFELFRAGQAQGEAGEDDAIGMED